jgi:beta-glucosidase
MKIFFSLLAACSMQLAAFSQTPVYKNKNLSPEARAKDLLSKMNLDEKVMQTQCLVDPEINYFKQQWRL